MDEFLRHFDTFYPDTRTRLRLAHRTSPRAAGRHELTLAGHRDDLQERISDLQAHLHALNTKIEHYKDLLDGQAGTDNPWPT